MAPSKGASKFIQEGGNVKYGALATYIGNGALYAVFSAIIAFGAALVSIPRRLIIGVGDWATTYVTISIGGIDETADTAWGAAYSAASQFGIAAPLLLLVVLLATLSIGTLVVTNE